MALPDGWTPNIEGVDEERTMDFTLRIFTEKEARELLQSEDFLSSWSQLAQKDKKVTVMQEPTFALTWYEQYSTKYTPVLCVGFDKDENPIALMPLAKNIEDGSIVHAGAHQAEYHGWVAESQIVQDFPIKCLIQIKRTFKLKVRPWRWLPPKAPIDWLSSPLLKTENIYVRYKTQASPVWDLGDNDKFDKLTRIKSIRNNINRYQRVGDF